MNVGMPVIKIYLRVLNVVETLSSHYNLCACNHIFGIFDHIISNVCLNLLVLQIKTAFSLASRKNVEETGIFISTELILTLFIIKIPH